MPMIQRTRGETSTSPIENWVDVQRISFGPLMFQAAMALRDMGVLRAVGESGSTGSTTAECAARASVSVYAAQVLLDAGLSMELVTLNGDRYRITRSGALVLDDEMTRINMDFVQDVCYRGMFHLQDSLREARPAGLDVFGRWNTIYEALSSLPRKVQESWFRFDHFYSDPVFPLALPLVFRSGPRTLLDVGGNTGRWAVASAQHDTEVRITILDHPGQLARAAEATKLAGVEDRVTLEAFDLLDHSRPFPTGFDAVWMSQFLVCFGASDIVQLLKRAASALSPKGRLYVLDNFWDRQPNEAARYCLHATSLYFTCLANGTSRMYASADMLRCIAEAGLVVDRDQQLGMSHTLLTLKPSRP